MNYKKKLSSKKHTKIYYVYVSYKKSIKFFFHHNKIKLIDGIIVQEIIFASHKQVEFAA